MRQVVVNARARLKAADPKFHPGPDPLELEMGINVIQPRDTDQLLAMTKILEEQFGSGTPQQKQALEFWRIQVAAAIAGDNAKFEFLRRFYFWLLGRGTDFDHGKTFWGRANAAVYNGEVAAYIDQFTSKRTDYALRLSLLANRVPDSLNGYYLYFKYIVNGHLKRSKDAKTGVTFYDISEEDYLQDFDVFQQTLKTKNVFDKDHERPGYSEIIAPAAEAHPQKFDASVPYPTTRAALERKDAKPLDVVAMQKANTEGVAKQLMIERSSKDKEPGMGLGTSEADVVADLGEETEEITPTEIVGADASAPQPIGTDSERGTTASLPPKDKEEADDYNTESAERAEGEVIGESIAATNESIHAVQLGEGLAELIDEAETDEAKKLVVHEIEEVVKRVDTSKLTPEMHARLIRLKLKLLRVGR